MVRVLKKTRNSPIKVSQANPIVFKSPKKKDSKMSKGFQGTLSCSPRSMNTRYFAKHNKSNLNENHNPQTQINICQSVTKKSSVESKLGPIKIEIPLPEEKYPAAGRPSPRLCKIEPEVESKQVVLKTESELSPSNFNLSNERNLDSSLREVKLEHDSLGQVIQNNSFQTKVIYNNAHFGAVLEPDMVPYYETEVLITETEVIVPESHKILNKTEINITAKICAGTPPADRTKSPKPVISPLPHKIQLGSCVNDDIQSGIGQSPSSALSTLHISETKKAVKSRRRLNPSQTSNQQACPKAGGQKPSSRMSKKELAAVTSHKLTDYYPIRRSERKTKTTVLEEKQMLLEKAVKANCEDGLQVCNFEGKGRGIVATQPFYKGDFVVEYSGELIDMSEAKAREHLYTQDQNTGCYMYYFKYKNNQYCIDATVESGRLGRLVNHSRNGNLTTKTVPIEGKPHLVLIAKQHIAENEEVLYDYGDRSKESLVNHPWLNL